MVDYEGIAKLFDPKHKNWTDLYSDHSKAHKKALRHEDIEEDTTGLEENEIVEQVAKYMHAYDNARGVSPDWDKLKEYQREVFTAKAREHLEAMAQNEKMSLEELIQQLQKEGLEGVFGTYHAMEKGRDIKAYGKSITDKHVKRDDWEEWKEILGEKDPMRIKGVSDTKLAENLADYVGGHFIAYHGKSEAKKKK